MPTDDETNELPQPIPVDRLVPGRRESIRDRVCLSCKGPAIAFKDELSRREFSLSGLCQTCQDGVFDVLDPTDDEPCAWCGRGTDDSRGELIEQPLGETFHELCWTLALVGIPIDDWPIGVEIPTTPAPWDVHPEPVPAEEQIPGHPDTRYHLATEIRGEHACIGVVGLLADAELFGRLAHGRGEGRFGSLADCTPLPWLMRPSDHVPPGRIAESWHIYAEIRDRHVCIGELHRLGDAVAVVAGSRDLVLAIGFLATADRHGKEAELRTPIVDPSVTVRSTDLT